MEQESRRGVTSTVCTRKSLAIILRLKGRLYTEARAEASERDFLREATSDSATVRDCWSLLTASREVTSSRWAAVSWRRRADSSDWSEETCAWAAFATETAAEETAPPSSHNEKKSGESYSRSMETTTSIGHGASALMPRGLVMYKQRRGVLVRVREDLRMA